MSGTCKDCRHWLKNVEPDVLAKTSTCLRAQVDGPYATALTSGTKAIVTSTGARLKTAPGFGCNQFEVKEVTT